MQGEEAVTTEELQALEDRLATAYMAPAPAETSQPPEWVSEVLGQPLAKPQ